MSLLVLDVENRYTHLGLFDDGRLVSKWSIATAARTFDEIGLVLAGMLGEVSVDRAVVSSVVPSVTGDLRLALEQLAHSVTVVGPGIKTGLALAVDNPRDVGSDRVVGAMAAVALYGTPVIVVDFRTATTIDAVDSDGVFRGGAIAAGLEVSASALAGAAAALRHVDLVRPAHVLGKGTVEAIQSGIVLGAAAMVDGLVERIERELGMEEIEVVATGRLAAVVAKESTRIGRVDEDLTLTGLRLVAERNPI